MKYNFNEIIDRSNNYSVKYDETYIKNSKLLISTNSENKESILAPYEAAIYERESD